MISQRFDLSSQRSPPFGSQHQYFSQIAIESGFIPCFGKVDFQARHLKARLHYDLDPQESWVLSSLALLAFAQVLNSLDRVSRRVVEHSNESLILKSAGRSHGTSVEARVSRNEEYRPSNLGDSLDSLPRRARPLLSVSTVKSNLLHAL